MSTKIKMPTTNQVKTLGVKSLVAGAAGGIGVAIGSAILGPTLGAPAGAIVAGAAVGGDAGEIIAINGVMDGMVSLFLGGSGSSSAGVM